MKLRIEVTVTGPEADPVVTVDGKPLDDTNDTAAAYHLVRAAAKASAKAGGRLNIMDAAVIVASLSSGTGVSLASIVEAVANVRAVQSSRAADKRRALTVVRGGM